MKRIDHQVAGFTLVELSIVLVIIGLIIGGVIAGNSLIRAAKYRKVYSEYTAFKAATNAFKGKYSCLPGDCVKAYDYLGADCGTNALATSAASGACNGNGDGWIGLSEMLNFWQHLSLAGLIEGSYTGTYTTDVKPGVDAPASASDAAFWGVMFPHGKLDNGSYNWDPALGAINYDNAFLLGTNAEANNGYPRGGKISGEMANYIDSKYDDGKPRSGAIRVHTGRVYVAGAWTWQLCYAGSSYNINDLPYCIMLFTF